MIYNKTFLLYQQGEYDRRVNINKTKKHLHQYNLKQIMTKKTIKHPFCILSLTRYLKKIHGYYKHTLYKHTIATLLYALRQLLSPKACNNNAVFSAAIVATSYFFNNAIADNIKNVDYLSLSLEELGKIEISIATGNNTTLEQAPAVANLITAQQIAAMGARTLDDVLETVPGLHVSLSAANRLDSIYSIRGIHTRFNPQVLLLINGSAMQWPVQGGRPILFRQPVNNIAQIEIIRGPGSAVYGADAFSGVINIITKSASDINGTEIGSRFGSFAYGEAWVQTGQQYHNWDIAFSLNYQHSNGDSDRRIDHDLQTTLDNLYGTSASLAPGKLSTYYEVLDSTLALENNHWKINLRTWMSDNTGNGAGGAQALDPNLADNYELYSSDITYTTDSWFYHWTNSLKLNYNYHKSNSQFMLLPPNSTVGIGEDGNLNLQSPNLVTFTDGLIGNPGGATEDAQLELTNTYTGIKNSRFRIGIGSRYQSIRTEESKNFGPGVLEGSNATTVDGTLTVVTGTDNIYLKNTSRTINYASLQNEWHFKDNWHLITGIRYDHYSDFGDTTNPRIALVWQTHDTLTSKLLYGSAFRAPSFAELGLKNNPSALGDPDLSPEKIDTYELVFNYRPTTTLQSTLSLFTYRAKDLIEYTLNTDAGGNKATNASDQQGYGFEWEIDWKINEWWRINSNYAWQKSKNIKASNTVADAPNQQLTINSYWKASPKWLFHNQINWVADRKRELNDTRSDIDDYVLVDLTIKRKNIYKNLDISLGINNLFDENATEPSDGTILEDIPLEGRSLWGEIRYQF